MAVIGHRCVMFYDCSRVDNAVASDLGAGIDDGAVHHDGACANAGVARDMGGRCDDDRALKSQFGGQLIEANAVIGCLNLAHRNEGILMGFGECRQIIIRSNNGIAEVLVMPFFRHADQPGNLILTMLLNDIDA